MIHLFNKEPLRRIYQLVQHCLPFLAFVLMSYTLAAETNQELPVHYELDGNATTKIEGEVRIVEMTDNVRVTQGALEILGDEAIFEYDAATDELIRVTVYGAPARYRQQREDGAQVTGSSETVVLYRDEQTNETVLEFIGEARINSPDSSMNCAAIIYQTESELMEGTGPCEGSVSPSIQ